MGARLLSTAAIRGTLTVTDVSPPPRALREGQRGGRVVAPVQANLQRQSQSIPAPTSQTRKTGRRPAFSTRDGWSGATSKGKTARRSRVSRERSACCKSCRITNPLSSAQRYRRGRVFCGSRRNSTVGSSKA
eukprot:1190375-Prorocentrum_minimum.AAC.2